MENNKISSTTTAIHTSGGYGYNDQDGFHPVPTVYAQFLIQTGRDEQVQLNNYYNVVSSLLVPTFIVCAFLLLISLIKTKTTVK